MPLSFPKSESALYGSSLAKRHGVANPPNPDRNTDEREPHHEGPNGRRIYNLWEVSLHSVAPLQSYTRQSPVNRVTGEVDLGEGNLTGLVTPGS